jgi:hypothetical protein
MVLVMIICAHIPGWRWVAVLLSKDGNIDEPSGTASALPNVVAWALR